MKSVWQRLWRGRGLTFKLTTSFIIMIIISVVSVTALALNREQASFHSELEKQAELTLDVIGTNIKDPLYYLDVDQLSDVTQNLRRQEVVIMARIYDADGRIIADAYGVDIQPKHEVDVFGRQLVSSVGTVFDWQDTALIAGKRLTVGHDVLGAVSVGLPTANLKNKINSVRENGLNVALTTTLVGIVVAFLIGRSVTDPLNKLIGATEKIADGDLTHEIKVQTNDETAVLAQALEQMRTDLLALYGSLEQQVAERTEALSQANADLETEIAERKRAEQEVLLLNIELEERVKSRTRDLADANEQLKELDRLKSKFVADVSHELRTPVANISLYFDLMTKRPENGGRYTTIIQHQLNRLTDLIEEILDISRLEVASKRPYIPVDLNEIIQEIVHVQEPRAEAKGIIFRSNVDPQLPFVLGDDSHLAQLISNLVDNAIKYTESGEVIIRTLWHETRNQICLCAIDTGIGIPKDEQNRVFDRFYRGTKVSQYAIPGAGLGLSIVKEIVTNHQGEIQIESFEGVGTTIYVYLPPAA